MNVFTYSYSYFLPSLLHDRNCAFSWVKGKILLTQLLSFTHISFLIYVPYWFLGLEKILSATVKPFDTRLLLSVWMKVSVDIEGNFSPSKIP